MPKEYQERDPGFKIYDYALLKLKKKVDETNFIPLYSDASEDDPDTTLSIFGYPKSKYEKSKE